MTSGMNWWLVATVTSSVAFLVLYYLWTKRTQSDDSRAKPRKPFTGSRITDLAIYPIKSCGGIKLTEAVCTNLGLQHRNVRDRHWIVARDTGLIITQRQKPSMVKIAVDIVGDYLHVTAPGMPLLKVPVESEVFDTVVECSVFGRAVPGADCGEEPARWFSEYLGQSVRLFSSPESLSKSKVENELVHRKTRNRDDGEVVFADGYAYLLANESSLDELNTKLDEKLEMTRFRPNIVVRSENAYDEDGWRELWLGTSEFYNERPCDRCAIPTINLETAVKHPESEPLPTLRKDRVFKAVSKSSPCFGVNLVLEQEGIVRVGDLVYGNSVVPDYF